MIRTAKYVAKEGEKAELMLKLKHSNNPNFSFLLPSDSLFPYYQFLKVKHPVIEEWLQLNQPQTGTVQEDTTLNTFDPFSDDKEEVSEDKKAARRKKAKLMLELLETKQ